MTFYLSKANVCVCVWMCALFVLSLASGSGFLHASNGNENPNKILSNFNIHCVTHMNELLFNYFFFHIGFGIAGKLRISL